MRASIINKLKRLDTCNDAIEWAEEYPTFQVAWDSCQRGDWMAWLLGKFAGKPESRKRKKLVLTLCDCDAMIIKYSASKNRNVLRRYLRLARAWARGKVTIDRVYAVELAIEANGIISTADADIYAAIYAAVSVASVADASIRAFLAVSAVASAAPSSAEYDKIISHCARMIRKQYPKPPSLQIRRTK